MDDDDVSPGVLLLQVRFDEIFAEPETEIYSFDKVWRLSFKVMQTERNVYAKTYVFRSCTLYSIIATFLDKL